MKNITKRATASFMALLLVSAMILGMFPMTEVYANEKIAVTITHPEMNTIKLKWNEVKGATGYHIYYSTAEKGKYELASSIKDTSIIFQGLDTDKYYYFKVVAYTLKGGQKTEGASSGVLKIRSNRIGIDVSKWQETIDWNKVKADGIEFVFARIAYGTKTVDKYFNEYYEKATKVGLPFGAYIYSTGTTVEQVKKEANMVLDLLKGKTLTYPIVFDIENDSMHENLSVSTNTKLVKTFADIIEKAGYEVVLYSGCYFSRTKLDMKQLTKYDWWIAHYPGGEKYVPYNGLYHFKNPGNCYASTPTRFWQYTEKGKVSGVSGNVDMNYELDLNEPKESCTYVNVKTKEESYKAGKNETIESIANKLGVATEVLVDMNAAYGEQSVVAEGQSIKFDTRSFGAPFPAVEVESMTSIRVSYPVVPGATGYHIYSATSKDGTYKKLATTTDTSYVHTGLTPGKTYYYKVNAYRMLDGELEEATSSIVSQKITVTVPTNVKAVSASCNSNKVTWNKVAGVKGYKVYASTSKNGTYKAVKTTTGTSFTHTNLENNKKVYYKVKAYVRVGNKDYESAYSKVANATPIQPVVTNLKASATTDTSITVSYTKSANATSYEIFRATSKNGSYKKVATTKSTSYKNTGLKSNTKYYYKVRAVRKIGKKEYRSAYSDVLQATTKKPAPALTTKPAVPKITKIEGHSKRVTMNWSTVKNVSGYEIYRSTSKNGTYKLVTRKSPTYVNNTGLAANTRYYYKVRSYSEINKKKYYSKYSEIKSVKTLK